MLYLKALHNYTLFALCYFLLCIIFIICTHIPNNHIENLLRSLLSYSIETIAFFLKM